MVVFASALDQTQHSALYGFEVEKLLWVVEGVSGESSLTESGAGFRGAGTLAAEIPRIEFLSAEFLEVAFPTVSSEQ